MRSRPLRLRALRSRPAWRTRLAAGTLAGALAITGCSGSGGTEISVADAAEAGTESTAVVATTTSDATDATDATDGEDASEIEASGEGLFDEASVHTVSITFDTAAYDAMIETYTSTGDKEWIEGTVTIDGVTYEQVGLRLKGNSSLRGLTGGGGGTGGEVSADDPSTLPWLVDLDRNVEDQEHFGLDEFVVRANASATSLNEAVALDLLEEAGLASQDSALLRLSINGSSEVLRLAVENPDGGWMEDAFSDTGALYKAESTGDWSYRGDDPASYDEVFDQEAGDDNADLTPLIEFLDFINNSDDETFAAELPDWLDVDSFATYLAMQDLVDNFDDIDGPGNNAYLYYDTTSGQFTVVPWDYNLAFGMSPGGGGMGGMGGGQRPDMADGERPEFADGEMPTPPGGANAPGGGEGGGMFNRSNPLVERFRAVEEFEALYQQALVDLQASLYDSGEATSILDRWVSILQSGAGDLVDEATVTSEADSISSHF